MNYFLRPGLKEFLEFCLINFEVIFWTTADTKTLEPQYQKLLEVCPALGENRATLGRRWCDQSSYLNLITKRYDNYLKRLDRVLMDMRCLGEYCHLRDEFLLVDPLAYRNVLNNPFNAYHPTMYHRKSKEEERDAPVPYLRHSVQPFFQGLLDSGKTVPQCEHYRQYRRLVVLFFLVFSKFLLDISSSRVKRWQTRFILS